MNEKIELLEGNYSKEDHKEILEVFLKSHKLLIELVMLQARQRMIIRDEKD